MPGKRAAWDAFGEPPVHPVAQGCAAGRNCGRDRLRDIETDAKGGSSEKIRKTVPDLNLYTNAKAGPDRPDPEKEWI